LIVNQSRNNVLKCRYNGYCWLNKACLKKQGEKTLILYGDRDELHEEDIACRSTAFYAKEIGFRVINETYIYRKTSTHSQGYENIIYWRIPGAYPDHCIRYERPRAKVLEVREWTVPLMTSWYPALLPKSFLNSFSYSNV
jgi:hypothetical protein